MPDRHLPVDSLWAKDPERILQGRSPYPLRMHLLDSYCAALAVWDYWLTPRLRRIIAGDLTGGDESAARGWVAISAALHDLGKASDIFQAQRASTWPGGQRWREVISHSLAEHGFTPTSATSMIALRSPENRVARRHELIGLASLLALGDEGVDLTDELENLGSMRLSKHWLTSAVGGHHGLWHQPTSHATQIVVAQAASEPTWLAAQAELVRDIEDATGMRLDQAPQPSRQRAGIVTILVTGLVVLSDWLASSDQSVAGGYTVLDETPEPTSRAWITRRTGDQEEIVKATLGRFVRPEYPLSAILGQDADGTPYSPRPLQAAAMQSGQGAWFAAFPTGEGKTEAALLRHCEMDEEGLIFGLPTRATTVEMHARLHTKLFPAGNTVLLSHQYAAAHAIECTEEFDTSWYSSSVRRLIAPVNAATCDQILAGALSQKWAALRLLALANHHVVLDEVHTYDHFHTRLLTELLAWWGATETPVTLLSATLPHWQQREFSNAYTRADLNSPVQKTGYPACWSIASDGSSSAIERPPLSSSTPDLAVTMTSSDNPARAHMQWAVEHARAYPACSLAIVRSTVDEAVRTAQMLHEQLAAHGIEIEVVCLHSRMTLAHRRYVQDAIEARLGPQATDGPPLIVVATQVIEAALDYDFDFMSSDIAPAPSIIQRAGRLWRFRNDSADPATRANPASRARRFHGHVPPDRVLNLVVGTHGGFLTKGSTAPYDTAEIARVQSWLRKHPRIQIPASVQDFVDSTAADVTNLATGSTSEFALAAQMRQKASQFCVPVARSIAAPNARARYGDLAALTAHDLVEVGDEIPATRYIDGPTASYLVCHLGAVVPDGRAGMDLDAVRAARSAPNREVIASILGTVISVNGAARIASLDALSERTLGAAGLNEWSPQITSLRLTRPIDARGLNDIGMTYSVDGGLIEAAHLPGDNRKETA